MNRRTGSLWPDDDVKQKKRWKKRHECGKFHGSNRTFDDLHVGVLSRALDDNVEDVQKLADELNSRIESLTNCDEQQLAELAQNPDEVLEFCVVHGIYSELEIAVKLAKKHFSGERLSLSVHCDPESEDKRIVVDVFVLREVEPVLRSFDGFMREWVAAATSPKAMLIDLVYNF